MSYNFDQGPMIHKVSTRSTHSCWTCREYHIRCDGAQPTCVRCDKSGRFCDYHSPILPILGRRGVNSHRHPLPIYSSELLDMNNSDPFDTLPIKMTSNSKRLLHYFQHLRVDFETCPKGLETGCLSRLIHNAATLQDTLLVAGMHYIMRTRDIKTFDSTFLFHKIEIIQQINEMLTNQHIERSIDLTSRIVTMCLVEITLGNRVTAETHFRGLVTVLSAYQPADTILSTQMSVNQELTYRYLLLACNIIHATRSRMAETARDMQMMGLPEPTSLEEFVTTVHTWYSLNSVQPMSLQLVLTAISMLPAFFTNVPSATEFCYIDGLPFIECLRSLTALVGSVDPSQNPTVSRWLQMEASVSKLLVALTNSHAASLPCDNRKETTGCLIDAKGLTSSWCSIAITSELYLTAVLGLWNAGKPLERRLLRILFYTLVRDIAQHAKNWSTSSNSSDFWFWKHFVAAYSLAWHQSHEYDEALHEAEEFFDHSIRTWSEAHHIRQWEYAYHRLLNISWPQDQTQILARTVWAKAAGKPQRARKSKVRTGCITCKARHVKCDENKPTCKRCASSKIQCRGYADINSRKKSRPTTTRISTTLVPLRPRPETLI
ncbi:unnamed protein product [Clonostachys rosea f. rosea IK726]|uniref:Uncharacterized protein n=1 Tax=Clonostachys rosea f. rosea IK726 TaxID=1349383 RepID=A0ACA9UQT2_BIOOC|nr:unnamed protein product [Clonostachys rosea f. rosea IK726]